MWRMMQVAGHTSTELYELDGFNHGEMVSPELEILLKKNQHSFKSFNPHVKKQKNRQAL